MVVYALHTLGAVWLGTLPEPSQLNQVARVEAGDQPGDASRGLEEHLMEQLKMTGDGELIQGLDGPTRTPPSPQTPGPKFCV